MAAAIKNTKRLLISVILWFSFLIIFHRSIEENLFWALKAGESHLPDSLKEQLPKLFCDTCNEHSPKDLQTYQHSIPDIGTDPWDMGPDSPEPKLFSRPQFKPSQKEAASDIRELGFDFIHSAAHKNVLGHNMAQLISSLKGDAKQRTFDC